MVRTVAAAVPAFRSYGHGDCACRVDINKSRKGGTTREPLDVKCPSCDQNLGAADEGGLVNVLLEHLYELHALEMPRERVRENVAAQLKEFDGYSARPISGA